MSQELKQVAPEFTLMSHNSEEISYLTTKENG